MFALSAALLLISSGSLPADEYSERVARVEALTPEQKDELLRKKERFDALPDNEKDRLRELHAQLTSAENGAELSGLMRRYCNWLKGLTSGQRAELLSLPTDERIARMKDILDQQARTRFQVYVGNLPEKDREAIYKFLEDFIEQHEDEIIKHLPRDTRGRVQATRDRDARRRMLIWGLQFRRPDSDMPFPTQDEFSALIASLSAETQKQIDEAKTPEERQSRARELVRAAIFSRLMPSPSEDDLRKFYASLPVEVRERLEMLDSEQMRRELRQMYQADRFKSGRGSWAGWGPPGPPGPGPRPDGGRNDGPGEGRGPPRFGPGQRSNSPPTSTDQDRSFAAPKKD